MQFFTIQECEHSWGDYGNTLLQGQATRDEVTGLLQIQRTGPFVPPISFPGLREIVVTEDFRAQLEASGLTGFSFRPVVKQHIVDLDWQNWDKNADDPKVYPRSGEPEDYILERKHSPKTANKMPVLWELAVGQSAHVLREKDKTAPTGVVLYFQSETWKGDNLVRVPEVLYTFADLKAKEWLDGTVAEYVRFQVVGVR